MNHRFQVLNFSSALTGFLQYKPAEQLLAGQFFGLLEENPTGAEIGYTGTFPYDPGQRFGRVAAMAQCLLDRTPAELRFQGLDFVFVQGELFQAAMDLVCDESHNKILFSLFFRF
jgi:hypothetical protein